MKRTRVALFATLVLALVLAASCALAATFTITFCLLKSDGTEIGHEVITYYTVLSPSNYTVPKLGDLKDQVKLCMQQDTKYKEYNLDNFDITNSKGLFTSLENAKKATESIAPEEPFDQANIPLVEGPDISLYCAFVPSITNANQIVVIGDAKNPNTKVYDDEDIDLSGITSVTLTMTEGGSTETLTVGDKASTTADCYLEWTDNVSERKNVGEYKVTVYGINTYMGQKEITIKVTKRPMAAGDILVVNPAYTGEAVKPRLIFNDWGDTELSEDDFDIDCEAGVKDVKQKGTVTVKAKEGSNFSTAEGGVTLDFYVLYNVSVETQAFDTTEIVPVCTVKPDLLEGDELRFTAWGLKFESFQGYEGVEPEDDQELQTKIRVPEGWVGKVTYDVIAYDKDNELGYDWSDCTDNVLYVYNHVTGIDSVTGETYAEISWNNVKCAQGYMIYLDGKLVEDEWAVDQSGVTTYRFNQLCAGTTYKVGIKPIYKAANGEMLVFATDEFTFTTVPVGTAEKVLTESFKVTLNGRKLNGKTLKLKLGKKQKLIATGFKPAGVTNTRVRWTSSNTSVCTVKNGKLVAKKTGLSTITVTARDGSGVKVQFKVKVVK